MADWWDRAERVMPGGVNSPVRSFRGVAGQPFFVERAQGAYLWSVEGRRLIDYVMSYGPLILGHAPPPVVEAATASIRQGLSFGAPHVGEVDMAELLVQAVPGLEMVRMVNSGTEATMSALRIARAVTGRNRVIKFEGCYHGHHDTLLIRAGSGAATMGVPDSAGVPEALAAMTITLPFNNREALRAAMAQWGHEVAAVIVEPVAGNMGTVLPEPGFLETIREKTSETGALWIADEVMTGFRVAYGGACRRWGLEPDLITLGKVIGAGMPVAAYGGRRRYMETVAPLGPVYQAGTLSGNPVAMAAGLAQLKQLVDPDFYHNLESSSEHLVQGIVRHASQRGIACVGQAIGGMAAIFFRETLPRNFADVEATDRSAFRRFFHGMLAEGVFWPPSPFETAFPSHAHTADDLEATILAARHVFDRW